MSSARGSTARIRIVRSAGMTGAGRARVRPPEIVDAAPAQSLWRNTLDVLTGVHGAICVQLAGLFHQAGIAFYADVKARTARAGGEVVIVVDGIYQAGNA